MKMLENIKFTDYESRLPRKPKEKTAARGPWATIHKGREGRNSISIYGLPQFANETHFIPAWGEVDIDGKIDDAVGLRFVTAGTAKAMKVRKVKERSPYIDCPCPRGFVAKWKTSKKWGRLIEMKAIGDRLIVRLPANLIVAAIVDPAAASTIKKLRQREEAGQHERYAD